MTSDSIAPPPSPTELPCSLSSASGGNQNFKLTLFLSRFTQDYAVNKYQMQLYPKHNPLCSRESDSTENIYSCGGLQIGETYSLSVKAFNCGDQEGAHENFTLHPQSMLLKCRIVCIIHRNQLINNYNKSSDRWDFGI